MSSDEHLKHLEFIQAVVSRQAGNSFLIKGWSLTVVAALYGFSAERDEWRIAALGIVVALAFGGLDAYYLRQERRFRCLYEAAARGSGVPAFSMDPEKFETGYAKWPSVLMSRPLWVFYLLQVLVGAAILCVAAPASDVTIHRLSAH